MFSYNFRAVSTALVIGAAAVGTAGLLSTTAQAAVRPAVGTPLNAAISAAKSKSCDQATAKLREAENQGNKTSEETSKIAQGKAYIDNQCGAGGLQGKFNGEYNAGHYAAVIAMEDDLRKGNLLSPLNQTLIAQAYWKSGNNAGCVRYLRQNLSAGGEQVLSLMRYCAHDAGDKATESQVTEQLVSRFGKPEYWRAMLAQAQRTGGLKDAQTLDIYRLKFLTGSMATQDEYLTLAQLAMVAGLPKEAQAVIKKGLDSKAIAPGDRINRFNTLTSNAVTQDEAALAKSMAAANAAPAGDALVKMGEYQVSAGNAAEGIKTIQAGVAKHPVDPNFALVRLGQAYLAAKQKDEAIRTFASVKGDANWQLIARLWGFYARR